MKRCSKCKKIKKSKDFYWKYKKQKIRQDYCKSCWSVYIRNHYKENKLYYQRKAGTRKNNLAKWIKELKMKGKCFRCGFHGHPEALDFHHVEKKTLEISVMVNDGYGKEIILKEIRKCKLICANCHRIITFGKTLAPVA